MYVQPVHAYIRDDRFPFLSGRGRIVGGKVPLLEKLFVAPFLPELDRSLESGFGNQTTLN